jgi:hypothetical protein
MVDFCWCYLQQHLSSIAPEFYETTAINILYTLQFLSRVSLINYIIIIEIAWYADREIKTKQQQKLS